MKLLRPPDHYLLLFRFSGSPLGPHVSPARARLVRGKQRRVDGTLVEIPFGVGFMKPGPLSRSFAIAFPKLDIGGQPLIEAIGDDVRAELDYPDRTVRVRIKLRSISNDLTDF